MPDKNFNFDFLATGIGSVPFQDVKTTCHGILEHFPSMPFWPQLVNRSFLEDMTIQFSEGLPLLEIKEEKRSIIISQKSNVESELVLFYDHFLAHDINYFSISKSHAPGLYTLIDIIDQDKVAGPYIKGQSVGPVTFAAGILDISGKPLLHNEELFDAMIKGLAIKALWQVGELGKSGRRPILFFDEPYLSGFGSAFSSIQRHKVIEALQTVINYLKENSDALTGIHCCGNTDWPMILEAGPDIVSFDAFEYMEYFLLYPNEIVRFLEEGGTIAWGIVPTSNFKGDESVEGLLLKLKEGLRHIHQWGVDPDELAKRSILTPSCGMGTMTPETAQKGLALLSRLSQKYGNVSV